MREPLRLEYGKAEPRPKSRAWELFSDYIAMWSLALLAALFLVLLLLASSHR